MTETDNISIEQEDKLPKNFIQQQIVDDLAEGKNGGRVHTRFHLNLMDICILDMQNRSA
jgi:glutaminyl-tRNA synthetase